MKFLDLSNDDSMNNNSKIIITAPVKAAGPKYDAMRALLGASPAFHIRTDLEPILVSRCRLETRLLVSYGEPTLTVCVCVLHQGDAPQVLSQPQRQRNILL